MTNTTKVVSARGELVDFELIRIKEQLTVAPTTIQREKPRRRRKLSERGTVIARTQPDASTPVVSQDVSTLQGDPEVIDETTNEEAPTIVRRRNKGKVDG